MLIIPGSTITLPADAIDTRPTRYVDAWLGLYLTVILYDSVDVIRIVPGHSSLLGDWFGLDWQGQSPTEYGGNHSLPIRGNEASPALGAEAVWRLQRGSELNVGRCGPLFGQRGGGYQAEFLEGRLPALRSKRFL